MQLFLLLLHGRRGIHPVLQHAERAPRQREGGVEIPSVGGAPGGPNSKKAAKK